MLVFGFESPWSWKDCLSFNLKKTNLEREKNSLIQGSNMIYLGAGSELFYSYLQKCTSESVDFLNE